jgi:medium-chain acyl-[acyl-carrier-protein] hydrolase
MFGKWLADLPGSMETWIAHYPGRGSRHNESPIKELDELVGFLSQAIQPLSDKPFALFGHSMGGLVAFELARQLRKNDLPQPIALFVSGCGAPHLPNPHTPIHTLPDAEFLKALQAFNGIPAEAMNLPELMELLLPTVRADFKAVESYVYDPNQSSLDCPIIAFGGLDDPRVSQEDIEGWALHTTSSFKSQYFPGDHFFINTARDALIASIFSELTATYAKD